VSVITLADGSDTAELEEALAALPARLTFRDYRFGCDLGLNPDNASFGVVADFDTIADYEAYRVDPEHQRIIAEMIKPMLVARTVLQYEC
jgi:hypothetical protein